MAPDLPIEGFLLLLNRIMPRFLAPGGQLPKTALEPLAHRPDVDREVPPPASLADIRETEKPEGCGLLPVRLQGEEVNLGEM
jgi:hypothetical protein